MAAALQKKLEDLEETIRNLITSHQQLKADNMRLQEEKNSFEAALVEEKMKLKRVEEGYKELKMQEKTQQNKNIETLKLKIGHLVSEIDRNVALMNAKNK